MLHCSFQVLQTSKLNKKECCLKLQFSKFKADNIFSYYNFGKCCDCYEISNALSVIMQNPETSRVYNFEEDDSSILIENKSPVAQQDEAALIHKSLEEEFTEHSTSISSKIENKKLGVFIVDIKNCAHPCQSRLVREINDVHVMKIKMDMLRNLDISLSAPKPLVGMVLNCTKETFRCDHLDSYKIEIIDGNHNFAAQKELLNETDDLIYSKRSFLLYANLTNGEIQFLGVRCNRISACSLKMNDMDYCVLLRRELYSICNLTKTQDPPGEIPKQFKQYMASLLDLKSVSNLSCNNAKCKSHFMG
jgi:hypothetical protein